MGLVRSALYSRPGNYFARTLLRPFSGMIPEDWKFPVTGRIRIRLPEGKTLVLDVNPTCYAGKVLFWNGYRGFEDDQFSIFVDLVRMSDVFLDIGANIGYYSLLAELYNPEVEVVSFEPLPAAYDFLLRNASNNGLEAITPEQIAISNRTGETSFYFSRNPKYGFVENQLTSTGSLDRRQADRTSILQQVSVLAMRLDDYVLQHGLRSVDLIKLDTEATEHLVIQGARDVLSRFKPVVFCEVLAGRVEDEIQREFARLDYEMFRVDSGGLVRVDVLRHEPGTTNDYVFCHPEKRVLIDKHLS